MKKLAFVLLAATVFVSCKKSEDPQTPPLTSPGVVANVAGSSVDYGVPYYTDREVSPTGTETIFISAATATGKSIDLSLSQDGGLKVGTYSATNSGHISIVDGTDYYETTSNVNFQITAIDASHVVGFFSGTVGDGTTNKAVTEGKFYANF